MESSSTSGCRLYMDHHVEWAITDALRSRGVDVLTADEDGLSRAEDSDLLDRAGKLGRLMVTRDVDYLVEAARRQHAGIWFVGVVYAHALRASIGECVRDLEFIAKAGRPDDFAERVEHLPY